MRVRRRQTARWWWTAGLAILLAVAAMTTFLAGVPDGWLDRADKIASVGSLAVGVAALLVSGVALHLALRQDAAVFDPRDGRLPARVTEDLAAAVTSQWRREAALRHLRRPQPLRVRWSTTQRPVAASAEAVLGPGVVTGRPIRLRLHGDVCDVSELFPRLPAQQLVVLGRPGAGKTALVVLLTLDLLRTRSESDPVPVPFSLSSWNPRTESLDEWLIRRLLQEYPALRNTAFYGEQATERLVGDGKVIPILDGLDELAVDIRPLALAALDQACAEGKPMMLTSRSDDYQSAVTTGGCFPRRAAVVEIEPVRVPDAISFLAAGQPADDDRWKPVFERLRAEPDGPLARALSTPLMVQLARVAYARPVASPAELCVPAQFPDQDAVEEHFLDSYLAAAYAESGYPPERTVVWLAFLARHLCRLGTHDLAWWHLDRAVPRFLFGLVPGLIGGGVAALVVGPVSGWPTGLAYGLSGGLTASVVWWLARRYRLPRLRTRVQRPLGHLATGIVFGLATGLLTARGNGPAVALILGVAGGCAEGLVAGAIGGYGGLRSAPLDEIHPVSPRSVLLAARTASLRQTLNAALIGCFGVAATMSFFVGSAGRVAWLAAGMGAVGGLLMGLDTPSGRFLVTRSCLWCWGRLPWGMMAFLEDAHRRGVLRQAGAVYQFRHARLRDRLATSGRAPGTPATGTRSYKSRS